MKDVFDIQDDISRAIVAALEVQLGGQADAKLVRPQTASLEAYELCVKGRSHWNQRGLGLKKALHFFELALLEDPNYALAWSGLADAYFLLGVYDFLPYPEALAKAKTAAEKAVALDDHSAEAHGSLGVVLAWRRLGLFRVRTALPEGPGIEFELHSGPLLVWVASDSYGT